MRTCFLNSKNGMSYAVKDAKRLASLYGLEYPNEQLPNDAKRTERFMLNLNAIEKKSDFLSLAIRLFESYWSGDRHGIEPQANTKEKEIDDTTQKQDGLRRIKLNEGKLNSLGHYQSATIYFEGEWYWGVDRLDHLERRLNKGVPLKQSEVVFSKTFLNQRQESNFESNTSADNYEPNSSTENLFFYWSARSPYSYLALMRLSQLKLPQAVNLVIRPVLPMVMRGLPVPKRKKMYIFYDTKREADKFGIPYGFVADPLGIGVERCYALFEYAQSEGKALPYLLSYAKAVNAEGVHSETDSGMKLIVERAGLDWTIAKLSLQDETWRHWAQENQERLLDSGMWGVPSFHYGELKLWGQDRLGILEQTILAS